MLAPCKLSPRVCASAMLVLLPRLSGIAFLKAIPPVYQEFFVQNGEIEELLDYGFESLTDHNYNPDTSKIIVKLKPPNCINGTALQRPCNG